MSEPTQRFAGRVVNESRSTNAPGVRMGSFRFIRNHSVARFLGQVCLVALACFPAGVGGMVLVQKSGSRPLEILGGALVVVGNLGLLAGLAAGLMLVFLCRKMATVYREALLTPGVLVSVDPLEFAALANMSTGGGGDHPAVQRFRVERLPVHAHKVGTRFPCVAFFQAGDRRDAWGDFTAEPLCFATGDRAVLDGRMAAIGAADFKRLEAAIAAGLVPDERNEVRFLDDEPGRGTTGARRGR